MRIKAKLAVIVLGVALMSLGATAVQANDWDRGCEARIHKEQRDLDRDIYRYGYYSRQARRERAELRRIEERCHRDRDWYRDRD